MSENIELRERVRERYAEAATSSACCGPEASCSTDASLGVDLTGNTYTSEDLASIPTTAADASLGCGNPTAVADLREGETVLDLGSGGGIDVLLSAKRVGPTGYAYGLDMTDEMLDLARRNAAESGASNVEFLKGYIEDIPLPDDTIDVIISNCVINLAADKDRVLREAHRVLRPGGRFAVSDVVLRRPLPPRLQELIGLWTGCVAGALTDDEYRSKLAAAGFVDVEIQTTHVHDRAGVEQLAALVEVPDDLDVEATIDEVADVVTNAFVRARRA